jgi:hypothetical protein
MAEQVERVTLDNVHALAARCFGSEGQALTLLGELPPVSDYQTLLEF